MSAGTPFNRLPRLVEPRKLAHSNALFEGEIAAQDAPRIAEAVSEIQQLQARLEFDLDDRGHRVVVGQAKASVTADCQRCLQPVEQYEVSADIHVAIVWDEDQAKALPKDLDPWIVGEGDVCLYDLVEEEILLNLPSVIYHDYDCLDASLFQSGEVEESVEKTDNPFAILADLKKKD